MKITNYKKVHLSEILGQFKMKGIVGERENVSNDSNVRVNVLDVRDIVLENKNEALTFVPKSCIVSVRMSNS